MPLNVDFFHTDRTNEAEALGAIIHRTCRALPGAAPCPTCPGPCLATAEQGPRLPRGPRQAVAHVPAQVTAHVATCAMTRAMTCALQTSKSARVGAQITTR